MHELLISLTGALVGFTVGLTGMGGGALMTPLLVLMLGVNPLAAVSSDLVTAAVMKPIGGTVHLRRGSVHWGLVGWLCAGSVPAAIAGSVLVSLATPTPQVEHRMQLTIGAALLVAVVAISARAIVARRRGTAATATLASTRVRPLPTVAIGILGGFVVSVTSVGSGSLMMVLLLAAYPRLSSKQLVSTDLWQAIPLVIAAAGSHLLFGHVDMKLVGLLVLGSVPGVYVGARISTGASDQVIRSALVVVLATAGLKMIGVPSIPVLAVLFVGAVLVVVTARRTTPAPDATMTPESAATSAAPPRAIQ